MTDAHGVARDQLRAFIERIERLSEEAKTIADDIRDVKSEAKAMGFSVKAINEIIKLRKKDDQERMEEEAILDTYKMALGMISDFERQDDEPSHSAPTRTPAMALQSPRKAAEAVSERTAVQVEDHSSAEATIEGQPSVTVATSAESAGEAASKSSDLPTTPKSEQPLEGGDNEEVAQPQYAATHQAGSPFSTSRPAAIPGKLYHEKTPFHPVKRPSYAACFPELTGKAFDELKADINRNGVIEPIVRSFDTILDGFARYEIARSLGIEYPILEYTGSDPLLDVIKLQRSSRDWTPAQEAKIAKALAAELPDRAADIWAAFHLAEAPDGEVVAA